MNVKNIVLGSLIALLGLLIVINPQMSIQVTVVLLGIVSVVSGVLNLIKTMKLSEDILFRKTVLIRSLVSIVVGLMAVVMPFVFSEAISVIIKVLLYVQAVYLIVSAVSELIIVSKLKAEGHSASFFKGEIIGSLIMAVLLFLLAANFAAIIVRIIGIIFILCGAVYVIYAVRSRSLVIQPDEVRDVDETDSNE